MDEKIIAQSEIYNIKLFRNIMLVLAGIFACLMFLSFVPYNDIPMSLMGAILYSAPTAIVGLLVYYWASQVKLTVTNKRVYGVTAFGKRVDLPLDSISAVGISVFSSISISTSSGAIKFVWIKNRDIIYDRISLLLIKRQDKASNVSEANNTSTSNAVELKTYKDLLDSGVITQEEFDAKKKQLLGL